VSACNGCKLKCEFTESRKSANQLRRCAIADTLAACSRPPAQSHLRFSMVENRSRRSPTPICVQNPRGPKSLGPVNCLPRRAIALGYSRRPCAGSRKHRRPRLSMVGNRSRRLPTPICVQRPRGPKSLGPVNACPVAPSLSDTSPDHAPARASTTGPVYRWSKIGCVARPRQYACKTRGGRNP
jgi:hypothetical protein